MNREEYLKLRLQRDFFKYTVLRENGNKAAVIAAALDVSAHGKSGDDILVSLRNAASREKQAILDDLFSFDRIKEGGSFVKHLPEGFGPELVTVAVERFKAFLNSSEMVEPLGRVVARLMKGIEKFMWRAGSSEVSEAIRIFLDKTGRKAAMYRSACTPMDEISGRVAEGFARADSVDRIIEFRSVLKEAAGVACDNALCENVAGFLESIVTGGSVAAVAEYAEMVSKCASDRAGMLPEVETVPEFEEEYGHLVPLEFYSRNIDKVDESKAFYMIMMLALASREEQLTQMGFLSDGEMHFFTREPQASPHDIFDMVLGSMYERILK